MARKLITENEIINENWMYMVSVNAGRRMSCDGQWFLFAFHFLALLSATTPICANGHRCERSTWLGDRLCQRLLCPFMDTSHSGLSTVLIITLPPLIRAHRRADSERQASGSQSRCHHWEQRCEHPAVRTGNANDFNESRKTRQVSGTPGVSASSSDTLQGIAVIVRRVVFARWASLRTPSRSNSKT
jgi:hypothetical protein